MAHVPVKPLYFLPDSHSQIKIIYQKIFFQSRLCGIFQNKKITVGPIATEKLEIANGVGKTDTAAAVQNLTKMETVRRME